MRDRKWLTALLMEGAEDFYTKSGALNCTKLTEYLLDHGVIIPPCKVGDTVYYIGGLHKNLIFESVVEEMHYDGDVWAYGLCSEGCIYIVAESKELYLTSEEAQAALKESGSND